MLRIIRRIKGNELTVNQSVISLKYFWPVKPILKPSIKTTTYNSQALRHLLKGGCTFSGSSNPMHKVNLA